MLGIVVISNPAYLAVCSLQPRTETLVILHVNFALFLSGFYQNWMIETSFSEFPTVPSAVLLLPVKRWTDTRNVRGEATNAHFVAFRRDVAKKSVSYETVGF
jgi:hypothetical protein